MDFEWDDEKNRSNKAKHGIRFESALEVFDDPFAIIIQDRYENYEERWQAIGLIDGIKMLVVAHTIRGEYFGKEIIRIISARPAERHERREYERARMGKS